MKALASIATFIFAVVHAAAAAGATVFHCGTKRDGDAVVTAGGRVIAVTAHGNSIEEARGIAYREVEKIHFEGVNYRHDIGLDLMRMQ